ncbi:DUF2156 domain-containing protein [Hominifimenecus sp. rT4P-3]|uniref:DUF2156 domain-containing protein n=1 Tax=Hominifimenecus sp. rT4P-3 TaxID=3242979 RepID=UPI003DA5C915
MNLQFKRLEAADVERLRPYFGLRSNKTCDSVILDSFLWKDFYGCEFTVLDERAVLMQSHIGEEFEASLPICRAEDMPFYFDLMEQYFNQELGRKMKVIFADEDGVNALHLSPGRYRIEEEADAADYVYDAESLRTLSGKKYHKKKNHVNAFLREYGDRSEYRRLVRADRDLIWEFLSRWREQKGDEADIHLDGEAEGIHEVLRHMEVLGTYVAGVFIDGKLEAFTMGSYNPVDRMAIIHIEKANAEIRGLYPWINQQFLVHEFPDALLVNREDDVGLPALRKAKESYYPVFMAKKYTLTQN